MAFLMAFHLIIDSLATKTHTYTHTHTQTRAILIISYNPVDLTSITGNTHLKERGTRHMLLCVCEPLYSSSIARAAIDDTKSKSSVGHSPMMREAFTWCPNNSPSLSKRVCVSLCVSSQVVPLSLSLSVNLLQVPIKGNYHLPASASLTWRGEYVCPLSAV